MREGTNAHLWLFNDHLGSTGYTVNSTTTTGALRYKPFGVTRYSSGTTPTSYRYTGQREEAGLGLYYYGARWYDPALGRFIQPDTIVPGAGDAKAFDRYAYVNNNPIKYNDPTGHGRLRFSVDGGGGGALIAYRLIQAVQATQNKLDPVQAVTLADDIVNYTSAAQDAYQYAFGDSRLYASESVSGLSTPLQDAIVDTIRESGDPNMVIAFRGRTPGSYLWEPILGAKPEKADTLFQGPCGLRKCIVGGQEGWYVSDLDPAFAISNGKPVGGEDWDSIQDSINTKYGYEVIQHGGHIIGFQSGQPGATAEKLYDTVYVFNQNGYVGSGSMLTAYRALQMGSFPVPPK